MIAGTRLVLPVHFTDDTLKNFDAPEDFDTLKNFETILIGALIPNTLIAITLTAITLIASVLTANTF